MCAEQYWQEYKAQGDDLNDCNPGIRGLEGAILILAWWRDERR